MSAKFKVGEWARAGGKGRPMPACYPWLKRGQLLRVQVVHGVKVPGVLSVGYPDHNRNYLKESDSGSRHHLMYEFAPRRGQPALLLASFDLRRPEERDRAPGAGRPKRVRVD